MEWVLTRCCCVVVCRDVPGYDERLLLLDGVESQFEEHRALRWRRSRPNPTPTPSPLPPPPHVQGSPSARPPPPHRPAQRKALEPVQLPIPAASASIPTPTSSPPLSSPTTPSHTRVDLAAFLQSTTPSIASLPRAQPSPTIHTRAAMDDVDAMFRDVTATLSTRPPSNAFCTSSLTAELSLATPAQGTIDRKARPSPVSFNIHEDTELIKGLTPFPSPPPSSIPAPSFHPNFPMSDDSALLPRPPAMMTVGSFQVYEDGEEDDVVLQTDEVIARGVEAQTPTSMGRGRRVSLIGLTPIIETSRESDVSSLSNVSVRSTSSLSSHPPTRTPAPPSPLAEAASINPLATSIQSLILTDLNVSSSQNVTSSPTPAPTEVTSLLTSTCEGMDVDIGGWWLRVEGRRTGEDVDEGEGAERRQLRVFTVTDMNTGSPHTLHLHTPPSLWEHHMSALVRDRAGGVASLLVGASHVFTDVSCSLLPSPTYATITLAELLSAYHKKGQALPPLLSAFYLHSLLHSLLSLSSVGLLHCALSPSTLHLPCDLLPTDDWQVGLTPAWVSQGLTVGMWTSGVDLGVWESEEGEWRGGDGRGAARVVWAMVQGQGGVEDVGKGRIKGGLKVGGAEGWEVVKRLWGAGGGEGGVKVLREVKKEMEVWLMGEGGTRARQVKKLLCTQTVMLSSS